jgi:nitrite reductase (NO-forming)
MGRRYFSVFGMVIALAIVLAACGSGDENEAEPTVTRIPNPPNAPVLTPEGGSPGAEDGAGTPGAIDGTPGAAGSPSPISSPEGGEPDAAALEVVSHDVYFEPDTLTIPADTAVTISIPNQGASPHNFSIDELEISVDQAPGQEQEVEITAPAGEYEFYCNVPGHREAGMVGTLVVE